MNSKVIKRTLIQINIQLQSTRINQNCINWHKVRSLIKKTEYIVINFFFKFNKR